MESGNGTVRQHKRLAMGEKLTGKFAKGGSVEKMYEGKEDMDDRDVLAEEVKENEGVIHSEDMYKKGGKVKRAAGGKVVGEDREDEDLEAETKRNPKDRNAIEEEDDEDCGPSTKDAFAQGGKVKKGIAISVKPVKVKFNKDAPPDIMPSDEPLDVARVKRAKGGRMKSKTFHAMKDHGTDSY